MSKSLELFADTGNNGPTTQPSAITPAHDDPQRQVTGPSIPDKILSSGIMKFLMLIATWCSLVLRDIFASYVTDTIDHDYICDIILAICFFLFLIEWLLLNCDSKYRGTYFFWLDFLSLLSMIPDVFLAFGVNWTPFYAN